MAVLSARKRKVTPLPFDLIAFDADDTLWDNEPLYHMGRERFSQLMAKYGPLEDLDKLADRIEIENLKYYGYGAVSFVISLIESAIKWTNGRVAAEDIQGLIDLSREMIEADMPLLEGVEETVSGLADEYPLMLMTKGDLLHQQMKVDRSGLAPFFRYVEVVSEKTPDTYAAILARLDVEPARFLMVGNSMRSDILPVLEIGGWAIHIPNDLTWAHEAVEPGEMPSERFFEVDNMAFLPGLIAQVAGEDRSS
jgi:putative hydrolase of the HAD superfamily